VKVSGAFGTFCSLSPGSCAAVEALGLVYYSPPADWYTQLVDTPTLYTMIAAADASIANNSVPAVASGISDVSIGSRSSICNLTSACTATLTTPLVAPYSSSQAAACVLMEMGPQGSLLPTQVLPAAVSRSGTTATASCTIELLGAYAVVSYKRALLGVAEASPAPAASPAVPEPASSPQPAQHSPGPIGASPTPPGSITAAGKAGRRRLGTGTVVGIVVAVILVALGGVAAAARVVMLRRRSRFLEEPLVAGAGTAAAAAAAGSGMHVRSRVVRSKERARLQTASSVIFWMNSSSEPDPQHGDYSQHAPMREEDDDM
jgi:hypothetical protein